jgi:hypothetical protein
MGDPMMALKGMGGMGGGPGGPPPGGSALQGQESLFNPSDAAAVAGRGDINPQMTVREVLGKMGIDVEGPASQLVKFTQDQMQKRTMSGKMGMQRPPAPPQGAPPGMPPGRGAPPPMPQAGPGGIEGLMANLKR